MKYSAKTGSLAAATHCLVCGLQTAAGTAKKLGTDPLFDAATQDFENKAGTNLLVRLPAGSPVQRILVAGGADGEVDVAGFKKIAPKLRERPGQTTRIRRTQRALGLGGRAG